MVWCVLVCFCLYPFARRQARLALTDATRKVIAIGLNLIGIAAPERM